jgi:hypothetical protein
MLFKAGKRRSSKIPGPLGKVLRSINALLTVPRSWAEMQEMDVQQMHSERRTPEIRRDTRMKMETLLMALLYFALIYAWCS